PGAPPLRNPLRAEPPTRPRARVLDRAAPEADRRRPAHEADPGRPIYRPGDGRRRQALDPRPTRPDRAGHAAARLQPGRTESVVGALRRLPRGVPVTQQAASQAES